MQLVGGLPLFADSVPGNATTEEDVVVVRDNDAAEEDVEMFSLNELTGDLGSK